MSETENTAAIIRDIGRLRNLYAPKATPWTGLSHDDQVTMSREWVDALAAYDAPTVADAMDMWIEEQNLWFPTLNDLLLNCREVERRRHAAKTLRMPVSRIVHCDGSGWTDEGQGLVPCPRCNPWLRKLAQDPPGWRRWLSGVPLHLLMPEITFAGGHPRTPEGDPMPEPCQIVDDPSMGYPTFPEGIEIARRAYLSEVAATGGVVDMKKFDRVMGLVKK